MATNLTIQDIAEALQDYIEDAIRERGLSDWRTAAQTARIMGISKNAVLTQRERGTLHGEQVGGIWLFHMKDIERKLKERPRRPPDIEAVLTFPLRPQ